MLLPWSVDKKLLHPVRKYDIMSVATETLVSYLVDAFVNLRDALSQGHLFSCDRFIAY